MGISSRAKKVPPFIVMDVLERAVALQSQGRDIIHLEVGEPDFDTPEVVKQAAIKAMEDGHTNYTQSFGIVELREAIAANYKKRYDVDIDINRIMVASGTSPAMLLMYMALLEPGAGDEVIISDPGYPCYSNLIEFAGGKVSLVKVEEEDAFQYRAQNIADAITEKTKAVVINSPANPTGQILSADRMQAIAELAPGNPGGPYIVSDEIYHGLVYEGREHSILEFTDNAFVLNGFSKLHAMTGWRLGYLIAPEHYVRPLKKMQQNFVICAPSISQYAGVAALTKADDDINMMVETYAERRKALVAGLRELGFSIPHEPYGAFYLLTRCDHLDPDDYKLAYHILEHAGVAVAPGRDFGPGAYGYLRFSYANSLENIQEGMRRLGEYLDEFYPNR